MHCLGDWNRSCTLSLFRGQFCIEKLYGELIISIIIVITSLILSNSHRNTQLKLARNEDKNLLILMTMSNSVTLVTNN